MSDEIDHDRRQLLVAVTVAFAAAQFGVAGCSSTDRTPTDSADLQFRRKKINTSFARLKQINAGLLNVDFAEACHTAGPPVLLLHGWPYDIYSYIDVAPLLAAAGYKVIVPYARQHQRRNYHQNRTAGSGRMTYTA